MTNNNDLPRNCLAGGLLCEGGALQPDGAAEVIRWDHQWLGQLLKAELQFLVPWESRC